MTIRDYLDGLEKKYLTIARLEQMPARILGEDERLSDMWGVEAEYFKLCRKCWMGRSVRGS